MEEYLKFSEIETAKRDLRKDLGTISVFKIDCGKGHRYQKHSHTVGNLTKTVWECKCGRRL